MSETQYDRLVALIMEVKDDVGDMRKELAVVTTTIRDYDKCVGQIQDHESRLGSMERTCSRVQEEKKNRKTQPGALKTGIIVGVVVGIIVSLVNLILSRI